MTSSEIEKTAFKNNFFDTPCKVVTICLNTELIIVMQDTVEVTALATFILLGDYAFLLRLTFRPDKFFYIKHTKTM